MKKKLAHVTWKMKLVFIESKTFILNHEKIKKKNKKKENLKFEMKSLSSLNESRERIILLF